MSKKLRSGYTTGTHATAVLVACFSEYCDALVMNTLSLKLPQQKTATIKVLREKKYTFSTIKVDNDDMDVTKSAKISCTLQIQQPLNLQQQTPSVLMLGKSTLYVWAGEGVGVVSKKGLKIEPNYPAINPTPLSMMKENSIKIIGDYKEEFHAIFEVEDGKEIAKQTANEKVGVLGGISILGTRGIVKPVSSEAYIDSIEAEINVAAAFDENVIVFTLGNSALDYAKEHFHNTSIVEIGNFVYDASAKLQEHQFKKVVFITSIAKMTKVAQEFKNTHNRFGNLDLDEVKKWIFDRFSVKVEGEFVTLKGLLESLDKKYHKEFIELVSQKSALVFKSWFTDLSVTVGELKVVTL